MSEEKKKKIMELAKKFGHSNLFATNENFDDLQTYAEKFTGSERAVAFTMMGLTVNTMAFLLAKQELGEVESK